ncbi:protein TolR [Celerinatantimonas yamalensis]|uniref:Tol-Pal system protein TolR n=1 Tax=Celerinatantimonas yamalensis TaxID=559956 RepID=A0ABW9G7D8_9GAMM
MRTAIPDHRRPRRKLVAEINVVPYIDVMLVLLIIFMVTAPLITQGVKVDLPQASSQPLPKDSLPPLVATVNAQGQYFLDDGSGNANSHSELSAQQMVVRIRAELQLNKNRPVVVRGDKHVQYNQVIALLQLLSKQAGVPSVGLMTQPSENQ